MYMYFLEVYFPARRNTECTCTSKKYISSVDQLQSVHVLPRSTFPIQMKYRVDMYFPELHFPFR